MSIPLKLDGSHTNVARRVDKVSPILAALNKPSLAHARGSILFREGQLLGGVYYIRNGRAKISISSASGKTLILRLAQSDDLLGLQSMIGGLVCESTAEIIEASRVNYIPRNEFLRMLTSKKVNDFVLRAVCRDSNDLVEATRLLLLADSVAERLASLLLEWCTACGKEEPVGITVPNQFTHQEIAEMIATSRETVTRLLGSFKKRNAIEVTEDSIVIRDRDALEIIARRR
jgi:CRP/FNR family transcriptional regulator